MRTGSVQLPPAAIEHLRKELGYNTIHMYTTYERGLEQQYLCGLSPVSIEEYWKPQTEPAVDGEFKCPKEELEIRASTRVTFKYPYAQLRTKMPTLDYDDQGIDIGFENGVVRGTGTFQVFYRRIAGVSRFGFYAACGQGYVSSYIDWLKPADIETKMYDYGFLIHRNRMEFHFDGRRRAVVLHSIGGATVDISGPPYHLAVLPARVSPYMVFSIEVEGRQLSDLIFPLNPLEVYIADGEENPSEVFRFYETGTDNLLAGMTITSGSVTSHPFPIFGFGGKTIYFQANQAGTLDIEVLMQTGNWRNYASEPVSANTLLLYLMAGEGLLARVTFTPTAYPAVISEAEVVLRGG